MTAVRPGQRVGYQCLRGNDDCPGHPSKWMLCPEPALAEEPHHRQARLRTDDEERALTGHGLDDAATLTRRMAALPRGSS